MGNQKQKWTAEEEEALLAGIAKHGPGKWKNILKDPEFAPFLTHRSNIDLKDKWRNLSVNTAAQGSKDKARNPKIKAVMPAPAASFQNATSVTSVRQSASSDAVIDDASQKAQDVKNAPRYNGMVFEALSTIKDTNGSDINTIVSFIEKRHEVPPNFRRALSTRLRRLVAQGKLEKIQNCYKIKKDAPSGAKTLPMKEKDIWQHQPPASSLVPSYETFKDAADTAAYRLAEAENKSFLAAEAVKEAERLAKFAEEADAVLQLVKEIYEQCTNKQFAW
ncbi:telomere repeat-binding factor 4-like isoform X2 [Prosopis cineraria]|uniref:telomere repeat-binding factor 4-like isoform X2 n=1 Tax=Prosopis cineraria TaxID=364024 RepID=UPI00241045DF|nr:telomere repeat-binding factor 4-like isoform X2 [Prosopis cineraria]